MLFHNNFLKRYINIKDKPESIANYLTLKTCEIENIKKREVPDEVVIGYVKSCEKHPDADKLKITQVDCGQKGIYQIVTGADNIKSDIYVPVALPGAYLPEKGLKIKPVVMRGIDSNGMICSKEELGIAEDLDKHGIWILNEDLNTLSNEDLGKKLKDEIPFIENFIFDIDNKTLTNRPDLTGHLGQSIELNAIYKFFDKSKIYMNNIPQIFSLFENTNIFETLEHSNKSSRKLFIDTDKVRTYLTLEILDVKVKSSNFKERLDLIDLESEPKNNWVDFSNNFMFLTSQPIHFFDADKIRGNIIVREANGGEIFRDLTGKEHKLEKGDIIIVDDEKILALAGIIGGSGSEITEKTSNILLEIANFDPIQIRKTANRLSLRTDAKIRFEKNINPLFSLYSLILFLDQIKLSGLDYKLGGINYFYQDFVKGLFSKMLDIDFEDLRNFSGIDISNEDIKKILENLGFKLFETGKVNNYKIKIPFWRSAEDINIKEDIYEEVIRIYGYENINGTDLQRSMDYVNFDEKIYLTRLIEEELVEENHFDLLETYPWLNENILNKFSLNLPIDKLFSLLNPTAPENRYLRNNLFLNLMEVIEKNFRFFDKIKILETGKIFNKTYKEKLVLGSIIYKKSISNWKDSNVLEFKNILNRILKKYKLKGLIEYSSSDIIFKNISHPRQYAEIFLNKQSIGYIFTLHPYYHKEFKLPEKSQITYLELDLEKLIDLKGKSKLKAISKEDYYTLEDQIVARDLSFVISKSDSYSKVIRAVSKINQVIDVEVFDIYDLGEEKSISLTIKIYGDKMTSDDINLIMNKAIKEVEKNGGKLRE